MLSVNDVFDRIRDNRDWTKKVLIGGLIMFVPIVNLFSLGYLMRYAEGVLRTGDIELPEWRDWPGLFIAGVGGLLVILTYGVLPLTIGWIVSLLLDGLSGGVLGWIPYTPFTLVALMVPTLCAIGMFAFKLGDGIQSLFLDVRKYLSKCMECWDRLIIPNFAFAGLMILGAPLYGFAIFLGLLIIIPYTAYVFVQSE